MNKGSTPDNCVNAGELLFGGVVACGLQAWAFTAPIPPDTIVVLYGWGVDSKSRNFAGIPPYTFGLWARTSLLPSSPEGSPVLSVESILWPRHLTYSSAFVPQLTHRSYALEHAIA
jgi:hypothetical protein